jgi:hypothetical protein
LVLGGCLPTITGETRAKSGAVERLLLAMADLRAHAAFFAPQLPPTLTGFLYAQGNLLNQNLS